jgi:hypothetical protein
VTEKQRIKYGFYCILGSAIELIIGIFLILAGNPIGSFLMGTAYITLLGAINQAVKLFNMKVDRINELEEQNGCKEIGT